LASGLLDLRGTLIMVELSGGLCGARKKHAPKGREVTQKSARLLIFRWFWGPRAGGRPCQKSAWGEIIKHMKPVLASGHEGRNGTRGLLGEAWWHVQPARAFGSAIFQSWQGQTRACGFPGGVFYGVPCQARQFFFGGVTVAGGVFWVVRRKSRFCYKMRVVGVQDGFCVGVYVRVLGVVNVLSYCLSIVYVL